VAVAIGILLLELAQVVVLAAELVWEQATDKRAQAAEPRHKAHPVAQQVTGTRAVMVIAHQPMPHILAAVVVVLAQLVAMQQQVHHGTLV
jgi:predicted RND superfamily exporter protein